MQIKVTRTHRQDGKGHKEQMPNSHETLLVAPLRMGDVVGGDLGGVRPLARLCVVHI